MIQSLKRKIFFNFKKKLIKNYLRLKKETEFKILPEFERDFVNTKINFDFKYFKDFQNFYNLDLNLVLKQMFYEKIYHRFRSYFIHSYKKKILIFLFPIPNIYKNLINNNFKSLVYLNGVSWYLISIFFFFRSLFKFLMFFIKSLFIKKKDVNESNSIFFCNITQKFLPISDEEDSVINWYAKNKNKDYKYFTKLKEPSNCKISLNFRYEKDIIPKIANYTQLVKLFIKVIKLFVFSFFQLTFFNRWQYVFLLDEIIYSYIFEVVDKKKICKEYIFINTQYVFRPIWSYVAEKKESKIKFVFCSTGILQNYQLDYIDSCDLSLLSWSHYHFWDITQLNIIQKATKKDFSYEIENYIPAFDHYSNIEIPNSDICIFDDPPLNSIHMSLNGILDENYNYEKCFSFLEDIKEVLSRSDLVILFKLKRYKRSLSKRYIHKINNLNQKNIIMIDPEISPKRLIEKTKLTISFPFSTPSLIAKSLKKKSIFYHPNKIRQSIYLNRDIPVIYGRENLQKMIKTIFD